MSRYLFSSLTRNSQLTEETLQFQTKPRSKWRTGDFVVATVKPFPSGLRDVELANGRMTEVFGGERVVGALGTRSATLQAVGDWKFIGEDGQLEALTAACVFGRCTSKSHFLPPLLSLSYTGHVMKDGQFLNMRDCRIPVTGNRATMPIILIIGTSMEAGKTITAGVIIRLLKRRGLSVAGAKFTGVGRYRDILNMYDAGADWVYDFVDAGLPSTSCPSDEYQSVVDGLLRRMDDHKPDVLVAEVGASPLEPYNGELAIKEVRKQVCLTVLCASDPYAVLGVIKAFDINPDLVTGRATSTSASIDLVNKLSHLTAIDILDPKSLAILEELVLGKLATRKSEL